LIRSNRKFYKNSKKPYKTEYQRIIGRIKIYKQYKNELFLMDHESYLMISNNELVYKIHRKFKSSHQVFVLKFKGKWLCKIGTTS